MNEQVEALLSWVGKMALSISLTIVHTLRVTNTAAPACNLLPESNTVKQQVSHVPMHPGL
jgi:hypothetical protein